MLCALDAPPIDPLPSGMGVMGWRTLNPTTTAETEREREAPGLPAPGVFILQVYATNSPGLCLSGLQVKRVRHGHGTRGILAHQKKGDSGETKRDPTGGPQEFSSWAVASESLNWGFDFPTRRTSCCCPLHSPDLRRVCHGNATNDDPSPRRVWCDVT